MSDDDLDTSAYDDLSKEELARMVARLEAGGRRSSAGDRESPFQAPPTSRPVDRDYATDEEWRQDVRRRYNDFARGPKTKSSPTGNPMAPHADDLARLARQMLSARVAAHLKRNSSVPSMREALANVNPEKW